MCATVDLKLVWSPPVGSPETSTVSFFAGAVASLVSLGGGDDSVIGVIPAVDCGDGSDCSSAGGGVGGGGDDILFSSRSSRCTRPGPLTTVVSFIKPVPGTNQRSILIEMRDRSSERMWNALNLPAATLTLSSAPI